MSFRPIAFLKCLMSGHQFKNSRAVPGHLTCQKCGYRKPL